MHIFALFQMSTSVSRTLAITVNALTDLDRTLVPIVHQIPQAAYAKEVRRLSAIGVSMGQWAYLWAYEFNPPRNKTINVIKA